MDIGDYIQLLQHSLFKQRSWSFMRNITSIGILIGITILVVSLVKLRKMSKILKNITDDVEYMNYYSLTKKFFILAIIGFSITSIIELLKNSFK